MRTMMFQLPLATGFAMWDRVANNGIFVAAIEHSLKETEARLTG